MAHAPPQPAPASAAPSVEDLDAQVERLVKSAAETAGEVRAVAEPRGVPGPHEPSLDELVNAATAGKGAVAAAGHRAAASRAIVEATLDGQVGAALKRGAQAASTQATDPPRRPVTIGPDVQLIPAAAHADASEPDLPIAPLADPARVRKPEPIEDEYADPAEELARAFQDLPLKRAAAPPAVAPAAVAPAEPVAEVAPPCELPGAAVAVPGPPEVVAPAVPDAPLAPGVLLDQPAPSAAPPAAAAPVAGPVAAKMSEPGRAPFLKRALAGFEGAVEPAAMRLGAWPKGTRDTIGWLGVGTLFWASVVWVYVLAFAPTGDVTDVDPRTFLEAPEGKGAHAAPEGEPGGAKAEAGHGTKKETKKKDGPGTASGGHREAKKSAAKKPDKPDKKDAQGGKKTADAGGH